MICINVYAIMSRGTRVKFLKSIHTNAFITTSYYMCISFGVSDNQQVLKGQRVGNATHSVTQSQVVYQWDSRY